MKLLDKKEGHMEYVDIMRPIIQKAGDLVMSHFRNTLHIERKQDRSIRTDVDVLSEEILKNELCVALPGSGFIAEETKVHEIKDFTWVIDPIDGTKNFARGLPYFGISVALMHHKDVIAAVTYIPAVGDWFYSQKNCGAWRNGVRLQCGGQQWKDAGALVVVSDFRLRQCELLGKIKHQLKALEHGVRFRVCGAATIDLAYASAGMFDAVLFENLGWWDAAAGSLLVAEAGGMVCQYDGSFLTPSFKTLIAGDPQICRLIMENID